MSKEDIKVFDVDDCIKTFRKSYKVPKKKKENIINYIFNIYLVLKNNKDNVDIDNVDINNVDINNVDINNVDINNVDINGLNINNPTNSNKGDTNVLQNISIKLDSKGLSQLLSYIKVIPEKYKLKSKNSNDTKSQSKLEITNNVDTFNVLQLENTEYPLLTYQNENKKDKKTKNKLIKIKTDKTQCMGRTAKHTRCSRSFKNGSEYCQSHINNKCPYGRFDEELKEPKEKIIKKRGRKRKVEISDKFKDINYETMWPEIVDGDKRLVDRYNNIYTFDLESPHFLGVKQLNGKINTNTTILTSVF